MVAGTTAVRAVPAARVRGPISVVPDVVTWDVCVFRVRIDAVSFVACVPGHQYDGWLQQFDAGELDDELLRVAARRPTRRLRTVPRPVRRMQRDRPARLGIEHELSVTDRGEAVDFRHVLASLFPGHVRADPADPFAIRFPWGVMTADGLEAEVATVPITLSPGFVARTLAASAEASAALRDCCGDHRQLTGYSTHVSVAWPARADDRRARTWARIFAPALMLLIDRPRSPGLLVRPRPGRLERCGDHCGADQLASVAAFAAGSVQALLTTPPRTLRRWEVDVRLEPALQRYGWYVDRHAFGADLYADAGTAQLRRADGPVSAARHLRDLIELVSGPLAAIGGPADAEPLRRILSGDVTLPLLPNGLAS